MIVTDSHARLDEAKVQWDRRSYCGGRDNPTLLQLSVVARPKQG
jgi:hypothetical protein